RGSADVLAVAAQDGVLSVFELPSGTLLGASPPGQPLTGLAVAGGEIVTADAKGTLRLHVASNGDPIARLDEPDTSSVSALSFDAAGRLVFAQRGILHVRDRVAFGAPGFFGRPNGGNGYRGLAVSPDGETVLARARGVTLGFWDRRAQRLRTPTTIEYAELMAGIAAFGTSGQAIAACDSAALLLDARTGAIVHR